MKNAAVTEIDQAEEKHIAIELNELLSRLLSVGTAEKGLTRVLKAGEIIYVCAKVKEVFLQQSPLIEIDPPVRICGDTHGQYADLLRLLNKGGFPPTSNYLFLGDYVDRGKQNLETILLLFAYKLKYPKNFFLLRGNHECSNINRVYGFMEECTRRYTTGRIWNFFQDTFNVMPLSALVGERILCMHGGLSPRLTSLEQLRNIKRPTECTGDTLEMDLLWADPVSNMRGASYGFGSDVLVELCEKLNIDMIARAHQVVQDGYEFFAGRRLVTIFSAPHYCGQFDNAAAMMTVDASLRCSFEILRPAQKKQPPKVVPTAPPAPIK